MREIVLDTETTGIKPEDGHRIIEIGCIEIFNRIRTGKHFHCYLNPEREVPYEAFSIHGIATEFLQDKPLFSAVVDDFLEFIADSPLVIHNAGFDMRFLNHELSKIGRPKLEDARAVDTLNMARKKFPGAQASLDALCKRFNIDLSARDKHGALLDAQLLSDVYAELMGGRQTVFELGSKAAVSEIIAGVKVVQRPAVQPSDEEQQDHSDFLKKIKQPIWETEPEKVG